MQGYRLAGASLGLGAAIVVSQVLVGLGQAQNQPIPNTPRVPMAPTSPTVNSVTPAMEGWVRNDDGTASMLIGYNNRNRSAVTIPVGPNNKIEPYGWNANNKTQDYGQPTYFEPGRQYGLATIVVPKDFGTKKYLWQITYNGMVQSILLNASNESYVLAPYFRHDNGNSPPIVKLDPAGPEFKGPPRGVAQTVAATVSAPLSLTLYVTDTGNTIDQGRVSAPATTGAATTTAPAAGAAAAGGGGGRGGGRGGAGRGGRGGAAGADAAAPGAAAPAGAQPPAGAQAAAGGGGGGRGGRGGGGGGRGEAAEEGCGGARGGGGGGRGGGGAAGGVNVQIKWVKHRGPGDVTFDCATPAATVDAEALKMFKQPGPTAGKAVVAAKFSAPGEYTLRAQLSDGSDFRDQCCWTNVHVKVNVK